MKKPLPPYHLHPRMSPLLRLGNAPPPVTPLPRGASVETSAPAMTVQPYTVSRSFPIAQIVPDATLLQAYTEELARMVQEEAEERMMACAAQVRIANPWEWLVPYVPPERQCTPHMRRCDDTYPIPTASVFPDWWEHK